jgi:sulfate adenylyltransferase subunit 1 (EFTu-like GTPase family)
VNRPNLDFRGFCGTIALGESKLAMKLWLYRLVRNQQLKKLSLLMAI